MESRAPEILYAKIPNLKELLRGAAEEGESPPTGPLGRTRPPSRSTILALPFHHRLPLWKQGMTMWIVKRSGSTKKIKLNIFFLYF
ncbi:hypothetical protein ACOSP7_031144 [Xanthoceras sorbifolium]